MRNWSRGIEGKVRDSDAPCRHVCAKGHVVRSVLCVYYAIRVLANTCARARASATHSRALRTHVLPKLIDFASDGRRTMLPLDLGTQRNRVIGYQTRMPAEHGCRSISGVAGGESPLFRARQADLLLGSCIGRELFFGSNGTDDCSGSDRSRGDLPRVN